MYWFYIFCMYWFYIFVCIDFTYLYVLILHICMYWFYIFCMYWFYIFVCIDFTYLYVLILHICMYWFYIFVCIDFTYLYVLILHIFMYWFYIFVCIDFTYLSECLTKYWLTGWQNIELNITEIGKGKLTPLQAWLLLRGEGRVRGTASLFQDLGARRGLMVSVTPRPHFTPGKDPVSIV
jgi:hypothetical protein